MVATSEYLVLKFLLCGVKYILLGLCPEAFSNVAFAYVSRWWHLLFLLGFSLLVSV